MSGENDAIDENFFATIDTPLKSYILGVIAFNTSTTSTPEDAQQAVNVVIKLNNIKDVSIVQCIINNQN
jgi:hypothetical protein